VALLIHYETTPSEGLGNDRKLDERSGAALPVGFKMHLEMCCFHGLAYWPH